MSLWTLSTLPTFHLRDYIVYIFKIKILIFRYYMKTIISCNSNENKNILKCRSMFTQFKSRKENRWRQYYISKPFQILRTLYRPNTNINTKSKQRYEKKFILYKLLFSDSSIQAMLERQFTQLQTKFHKLILTTKTSNPFNKQENHIQRSIKNPKSTKKKSTFFFTSQLNGCLSSNPQISRIKEKQHYYTYIQTITNKAQ